MTGGQVKATTSAPSDMGLGGVQAGAPVETGRRLMGLLAFFTFYLPNQAQLGGDIGLRGLNIANILFLLVLVAVLRRKGPPAGPTPLKGAFVFFFCVLIWSLFVGIASDASSWVDDLTMFKNSIFYMLLYFLFYHAIQDLKTVRLLFLVLLFVTFTSAFLGFRQALDYGIGVYNETRRVSAPFGWGVYSANRSAIFFCMFIPLLFSTVLFVKSRPMLRVACLLTAALAVFVVFHTYSRQSYFILAVLALVLAMRRNLLVAMVISIALLNYQVWVPETVIERIEMTKAEPSASGAGDDGEQRFDDSTESRFIVWEGAGQLILSRPWGIGFNHFKREIGAYVPPQLAGKDAHNFYVLFTTESGLVGPFAVVVLVLGLARLGRRVTRVDDSEESRALGVGYLVSLLAVVLGSIYGSRFLDGDVMANFWVLTALAAKYVTLKEGTSPAAR